MGRIISVVVGWLVFLAAVPAQAQCSMCKVTAESSIADGGSGVALGLNTGILYLASFPYLLAGIIIFMWYRRQKRRKLYEALNI